MPTDSQISSMADTNSSSSASTRSKRGGAQFPPRPVSAAGQPELKPSAASARPQARSQANPRRSSRSPSKAQGRRSRSSRLTPGAATPATAAAPGRGGGLFAGLLQRQGSDRRSRKGAAKTAGQSRTHLKSVPEPHALSRSAAQASPSALVRPPRQRASRASSRRSLPKLPAPLIYTIWLMVLGMGVAVIAGTLLSWLEPEASDSAIINGQTASRTDSALSTPEPTVQEPKTLPLLQSDTSLKASIEEIAALFPGLVQEVFFIDLDSGQYVDIAGAKPTPAASTIKLPILLAFFEEVDAGRISLNQTLVLQASQIGGGSGNIQDMSPGTEFTALEVASAMIITSDNTATNMIIDLLGGAEALNARFKAQGLTATQIQNPLPDLEGTNTTSPKDLVQTLAVISEGKTLTTPARDRVLNILQRTESKRLIPTGVEVEGAITYNKTGDIALALGDAALIDLPDGKRYALSVLVQRSDNDGRARELIQRVSQQVFQAVNQPLPATPAAAEEPGEAFIESEN